MFLSIQSLTHSPSVHLSHLPLPPYFQSPSSISFSSHPDGFLCHFMPWDQTISLPVSYLCPVSVLRPMKPKWLITFPHSPNTAEPLEMQHKEQTCLLHLITERGPAKVRHFSLSLGSLGWVGTEGGVVQTHEWPLEVPSHVSSPGLLPQGPSARPPHSPLPCHTSW